MSERASRNAHKVSELREGERYELSGGRFIYCTPSGQRHGASTALGSAVLLTDPKVAEVGVEVGHTIDEHTLRAPDLSVGNVDGQETGFSSGGPPLAIEYASIGQDERDLTLKIEELFEAGTQEVWVVRLTGPRRVEVHGAGRPMRTAKPGEVLEAPGLLANPVPVDALFDRRAAIETALKNLLNAKGYADLEAVLAQGREEGREEGRERGAEQALAVVFEQRLGRSLSTEERGTLEARLRELGPAKLAAVVLAGDAAAVDAWLARR